MHLSASILTHKTRIILGLSLILLIPGCSIHKPQQPEAITPSIITPPKPVEPVRAELVLQGTYDNPVVGKTWVFSGKNGKSIDYKSSQGVTITRSFNWSVNAAQDQLTINEQSIRMQSSLNSREQKLDQTKTATLLIQPNALIINGQRYLKVADK